MTGAGQLPALPVAPVDPADLWRELRGLIERRITDHPRSGQVRIGPSEIGVACTRSLGYRLAGHPEVTPRGPAWIPTIGTAVHEWLAETVIADNGGRVPARWIVESKVNAGRINGHGDLEGTCDVLDRYSGTVIDWKVVGDTSLRKYARNMRPEYAAQAHVYGSGWIGRGVDVRQVMVVCLPRNGELSRTVVWSQSHNQAVTDAVIARASRVAQLVRLLGVSAAGRITNAQLASVGLGHLADPSGEGEAAALPLDGADCRFCAWLRPGATDPADGCPGIGGGGSTSRAVDLTAARL